jgi:hypothetical protein
MEQGIADSCLQGKENWIWAEEEGRLWSRLARFYHLLIAVRLEPCRYRGMTVNKIPEVPTIRLDSRLCHIAAGTYHFSPSRGVQDPYEVICLLDFQ